MKRKSLLLFTDSAVCSEAGTLTVTNRVLTPERS